MVSDFRQEMTQANFHSSTRPLPELQSLLTSSPSQSSIQPYGDFQRDSFSDSHILPAAYNILFGTHLESQNFQQCSPSQHSNWDYLDTDSSPGTSQNFTTSATSPSMTVVSSQSKDISPKTESKSKEGGKTEELPEKKSASDRERSRMRQMNLAFDSLRKILDHKRPPGKRLSKIQALRFAIQYMMELEDILLDSPDQRSDVGSYSNSEFNTWAGQMYSQNCLDFGDQQHFSSFEESPTCYTTTPTLKAYLDCVANDYQTPKSIDDQTHNFSL